ncbi:uncharacterized protein LOC127122544 [Lathyrus oleraceus]|uniref:uncharacterized protein LOC127122544 n=1 Tax=Pisum sativum TaxID=3888 RepID=UPI0021CF279F|nr:uncharacterized protein LOC127122544 [Pisum sativum]
MKKEKGKDKKEVRKSISLKTSRSKSSNNVQSDCETRSDNDSDDEDKKLFVKRYNRYIWKNGVKHSDLDDKEIGLFVRRYQRYIKKNGVNHYDKNLTKFVRVAKASREDENKKGKLRISCYNYGEFGHYRLECPKINKDRENGHHKKSSKSSRAYGIWESVSDSSSDESSTSSVESARICLMENRKKKKNVSLSKLETINDLSYLQLQNIVEDLHREALKAFNKLASHEKVFLH